MARTIRIQDTDQIYFIRNITVQQSYLFVPNAEFNRLARGALARAATIHEVDIYAVSFLLNRFKMLARCPQLNLPEFMKSFQAELANAVNRIYKRAGKVFERRYFKADVLGEDGLLERFLDITNSPIAAGLVASIKDWPGVNSWRNSTTQTPLAGVWLNRTELRRLERKTHNKRQLFTLPDDAGIEHHSCNLERLPIFNELNDLECLARLATLRTEHAEKLRESRKKEGLSYLGSKRLRKAKWHQRPREYAHFKCPLSYGPAPLRLTHLTRVRAINRNYARAMAVYVANEVLPKFPLYTCRPGLIICEKPKADGVPA